MIAVPAERATVGAALESSRYRASLHRQIFLATGDARYAGAALPWDAFLRDFRRLGKDLLADLGWPEDRSV